MIKQIKFRCKRCNHTMTLIGTNKRTCPFCKAELELKVSKENKKEVKGFISFIKQMFSRI